ncbi:hypothetical protein CQW23_12170 [Capsicum baccatum]|uniref:Protein kinase domain-containing protein n=1 Tax=Capsicum baccatum TaxID=33114 RepID=A0A2G2WRY3_CAPBA|nr:hypothetical protein CQW23_12170 [Capsicum baccatum]
MVRPPKILLGSISYRVTVDLWSVGCVVAELFFGRPLLKGRTETYTILLRLFKNVFRCVLNTPYPYWYKRFLVMTKWNVDNIGDFGEKKYGLQIALLDMVQMHELQSTLSSPDSQLSE